MTDIDTVFAQAESLCRRIAPLDLGDRPLYIVPQSRVPTGRFGKSQCEGYTTGSLDLYCRKAIGGSWRGRGACMVINDVDLEGLDPLDIELYFQATAVHELAHILERPALFHDRPNVAPAHLKREAANVARLVAAEAPAAHKIVPFLGHGARFIRAVLHLCHRAQAAAIAIAPARVFCGSMYGLSHALCYLKALGTEPRRLAGVRMLDILRSPAPKAFSRLWTADVVHWFTVCPPYGERLFS